MPARLLMLLPSLRLAAAIVGARLSGNDKAPYLVLAVLLGLVLLLGAALVMALLGGAARAAAGPLALAVTYPLLYAAIVIVLARAQLIDSLHWLGFR